MYRVQQRNDTYEFIALVVIAVLGVGAIVFGFMHETEKTIILHSRWWVTQTHVKHDEYECSYGIGADGELKRQCGWETYTRCSTKASGTEPPITYPPHGDCKRGGDYITHNVTYTIEYHEQEQSKTIRKHVRRSVWDIATDGTTFDIVQNGFGQVVEIARR